MRDDGLPLTVGVTFIYVSARRWPVRAVGMVPKRL